MKPRRIFCILAIALTLLASFAGCAYNPETVLTIDGTEISSGVYLFYQFSATTEAYTAYSKTLESGATITQYNFLRQLDKLKLEEITVREWIDNKTIKALKEYVFTENEFRRLNLELSASAQYSYSQTYSDEWSSNGALYQANGISRDAFTKCLLNMYKGQAVNVALYEEGGELEIPFADLEAFFLEHYTRADYLSIPVLDSTYSYPVSSTDFEKIKEITQMILDMANEEGGDLKEAFTKYYPDIAAILGDTSKTAEEVYSSNFTPNSVINDMGTSPNKPLLADIFSDSTPGDQYKMFAYDETEEDYCIYIYKVNGLSEDDTYKEYESTLRTQYAEEPFKEHLIAATANYTVEFDNRARRYYSPAKVRLSA